MFKLPLTPERRFSAFVALCSLLVGLIIAPAADAWAFHNAGAGQNADTGEAIAEAPSHGLARCSILVAATVPHGLLGHVPQLELRPAGSPDLLVVAYASPRPAALTLLPLSRAPPSI